MAQKSSNQAGFGWMSRGETQFVSPSVTQAYVEISTHCNLSCRACVRHSIRDFAPVHLTPALAGKIALELGALPDLERIVLLGFGEPMCNPSFKKIAGSLAALGTDMVMVSNGALIDRGTAEFLFSLPLSALYLSWDDDISGTDPLYNREGLAARIFRDRLEMICSVKKSAGARTLVGIEIVATTVNLRHIHETIEFGRGLGVDRFIVSNLYPYTAESGTIILYKKNPALWKKNAKIFSALRKLPQVTVAGTRMDAARKCPFIERGTVFISSTGNVSPCPELAHTHTAFNPHMRTHNALHLGNIAKHGLESIWQSNDFAAFRNRFEYYDFPDCSDCSSPEACWNRNVEQEDCYGNRTPCGECLWAKGIIVCP